MRIRTEHNKAEYDKPAAYQAVMERIRAKVPHTAPQPWLADQLGVSRQIIYFWREQGFPVKHAEPIAKLLEMDPIEVCPSLLTCYFPEDVFNAILALCTPKKPFNIVLIELIELGLERERTATRHVKRKSAPLPNLEPPVSRAKPPETPMKPVGGFIPISAEEMRSQRAEAVKAGADLSIKGRAK